MMAMPPTPVRLAIAQADFVAGANSQPRWFIFSAGDDLRNDSPHRVDRDGKPDSRRRSRGTEDRGIHSDQSAAAVQQGSAGVPGIDGRINLNRPLDAAAVGCLNATTPRRYDSSGQRLVQAKRIADRENGLANLQVVALADHHRATTRVRSLPAGRPSRAPAQHRPSSRRTRTDPRRRLAPMKLPG